MQIVANESTRSTRIAEIRAREKTLKNKATLATGLAMGECPSPHRKEASFINLATEDMMEGFPFSASVELWYRTRLDFHFSKSLITYLPSLTL